MDNKLETMNEVRKLVIETMANERRRVFRQRLTVLLISAISVTAVYAAAISLPNRFNDGDTLSAAKLNDNFEILLNKVNSIDGKIERQMGTFCGKTASVYDGAQVGGYTGAKTKCETACSNVNAHMCNNTEITSSAQFNISIGAANVWLNMGFNQRGLQYRDCEGWTSNSGTAYGTMWSSTVANDFACNATAAIACCL